jgi:glycerate kinase
VEGAELLLVALDGLREPSPELAVCDTLARSLARIFVLLHVVLATVQDGGAGVGKVLDGAGDGA